MKVINTTKGILLADQAEMADTFFKRLIGLLDRKSLNKGEALILRPANCIHSLFMRFSIDLLFLSESGKVIAVFPSFKPFRISPPYFQSISVIELPEATIQLTNTQPGDIIQVTSAD